MGRIRVDLGRWSLTLTLALTLTVFTASVIAAHHFTLGDCFVIYVPFQGHAPFNPPLEAFSATAVSCVNGALAFVWATKSYCLMGVLNALWYYYTQIFSGHVEAATVDVIQEPPRSVSLGDLVRQHKPKS